MKNNKHLFEHSRDTDLIEAYIVFHGDKGGATFYSEPSCSSSQLGLFYVNEVSKLCSYDWMGQVSVPW